MDNNDILIRLRYAMDIKDSDMITIFRLGGFSITREDLKGIFAKSRICDNRMLESFLNGYIVCKRGKQESKIEESDKSLYLIQDDKSVNNVLLKKVKIALSLTGEDMMAIFESAGLHLSKSELSAVLRRKGQRNYKECQDRYARNFLKGLTIKYRNHPHSV